MSNQRRKFLTVSALASGAALTAPFISDRAEAAGPGAGAIRIVNPEMAKNMAVLNYKAGNQYVLGVKTVKGILDVAKAAKQFKVTAPINTDDLIQNGDQGLGKLVGLALSQGSADLFLEESKIEYAPAVTNPEKIICVGLNYSKHAKETNNPIPKLPILFLSLIHI